MRPAARRPRASSGCLVASNVREPRSTPWPEGAMLTLPRAVTASPFQESPSGFEEGLWVGTAVTKGSATCCFWAAARECALWAETAWALGPALPQLAVVLRTHCFCPVSCLQSGDTDTHISGLV